MPKGKILMGKRPVKPGPVKPKPRGGKIEAPDGGGNYENNLNPNQKKRPLPMPKPVPGGKPTPGKKPITRGPVKPKPKGGKVVERKLEDNSQKGYGAKPGGKTPMPKPKGKTKPVMPRRAGK